MTWKIAAGCLFMMLAAGCGVAEQRGIDVHSADEQEPIVLRYTSFALGSAQTEAIAEFEKQNPDIRIEMDYIQRVIYTAGLKTRLLGGEPIDVFDVWSPSLFEEVRRLDDSVYLDLTGSEFLSDYLPSSLEAVTIKGKVYGVPGVMHTDGLLYNKTMFEELGLQKPHTWAEFLQVCESLKQHGIIPIALNSEWWVPQFLFGSIMSNNGADASWTRKLENGELKVNNPILVDAMKKTKEIIDRGYVPEDWTTLKYDQSIDMVGRGKAAMIIDGTWDLSDMIAQNPEQSIGFMMVPGDGQMVPNLNVGSYKVISAATKHPEEAKRFLAFMNGREVQEEVAREALAVPSIKEAQVDDPVVRQLAGIITSKDAALYWPHTISTESLQVSLLEMINRYLKGEALDQVLDEMQSVIDSAKK
ncbi:raffinose/stachyose/melibiose transport system substrate-binding protein [Paenibacillus cellulosilyticus]|uniref:Raffinose/stachyose/melibiose transport system substrate-binding protein n=1 Tax=Paenibacillus cellulosilyticus TaxID=375489 RepID=A0A2V2YYF1_9BACL|nr:extracellular solute-binding protein [Paenibacillus cellulosilyticus]PWW07293.1 raffinose/stachyose/melibiose transport system substrate-binding protein [Paenibacillus cellulosilyticus]QKS44520.1 extracellular solute-binding protein [Paenibacillus cellulosilyticus]